MKNSRRANKRFKIINITTRVGHLQCHPLWQMSVTLIFPRRSICSCGSISPDGHACWAHPGRPQVEEAEQRAERCWGADSCQTQTMCPKEPRCQRCKQQKEACWPADGAVRYSSRSLDMGTQHMERLLIFQRRTKPVIHSCPFSCVVPIFRLQNGCSRLMALQELLLINNVYLWKLTYSQ